MKKNRQNITWTLAERASIKTSAFPCCRVLRDSVQKIQSLVNKPLLSQFPGRCVFTVFQLNTSLGCIRCVLSRLQSAGQQ